MTTQDTPKIAGPYAVSGGPRIYAALAAVQADIGKEGVGKDGYNTGQKFKFRSVDAVMNALNPLLSKHGVFFVPMCQERQDIGSGEGRMVRSAVRMVFRLYASDGSYVEGCTWGEAFDSGDKATNKAMAAAYKYAMFQTFCIPTEGGGDTDADAASPQAAPKPLAKREPAEAFGFLEDAMAALREAQDKMALENAMARIKASQVAGTFSNEDLALLRTVSQSRVAALKGKEGSS